MINTEVYFNNIKGEILKQIQKSKKSIYVAVAWFTDKKLFNELVEQAKANKKVEVLINKDDINFGEYGIDFKELTDAGGKLFIVDHTLMHNKYCIIDEKICITGSFNWTRKANNSNEENIVVIDGDAELASNYIKQFKKITRQSDYLSDEFTQNKLIIRLKLILELINLNEDASMQIRRLIDEDKDGQATEIIEALKNGQYKLACELIDRFQSQYSTIAVYIDQEIAELQLSIKLLEYQLVAVDNEIVEYEKRITDFNRLLQLNLGAILKEIYEAKLKYLELCKSQKQYLESNSDINSEFEKTQSQYEDFKKQSAEAQSNRIELNEAEKSEIKKLYREAVMLCHPDKFAHASDEVKKRAEQVFKSLVHANENNDIATVRKLLDKLKKGVLDAEIVVSDNKELLIIELNEKREKYNLKIQKLIDLENSDLIVLLNSNEDINQYFKTLKLKLHSELLNWKTKIHSISK
jgi:hypothetical protein